MDRRTLFIAVFEDSEIQVMMNVLVGDEDDRIDDFCLRSSSQIKVMLRKFKRCV